ncbi:MAG: hypothetical protein RIB47_04360 [Cyclobacteriaceae bacterium]
MQSLIQTPTNKLEDSLSFYEKLGFMNVGGKNRIVVTDGIALIEINPDRIARAGVKLFKKKWTTEVTKLKKLTSVHKIDGGHLLSDMNGVWIYLVEDGLKLNFKPSAKSFSAFGNCAGLSLESTDVTGSVAIWKTLGFKTSGPPDKGWVACVNADGLMVNIMNPLMCPHLFFNPSLTYFNGKEGNPKVIKEIRKLKIPIAEEITHFNDKGIVDNIIVRDPGGFGFFIFND